MGASMIPNDLRPIDLGRVFDDLGRMPLGSVLGKILTACVDAQENASNAAWDYVQKVLQHETPMVFTFHDGESLKRLEIPLITIVPLPYIKLDNISACFDADIKVNNEYSNQMLVKVNNTDSDAEMKVNSSSRANMHLDIQAGATILPAGLATLLGYINDGVIVEDIVHNDVSSEPEEHRFGSSGSGHYMSASQISDQIENNTDTLPKPRPSSFSSGSGRTLSTAQISGQIESNTDTLANAKPSSFSSGSGRTLSTAQISGQIENNTDTLANTKPSSFSSGSGRILSTAQISGQIDKKTDVPLTEQATPQSSGSGKTKSASEVSEVLDSKADTPAADIESVPAEIADKISNLPSEKKAAPPAAAMPTSAPSSGLSGGIKIIDQGFVVDKHPNPVRLMALHVNWTKPSLVNSSTGKYQMSDSDLLSTILSALLWRRLNGSIKMYTDNIGYAYYENLGMLDIWDGGVDTQVLENIPDDIPADIFWAGAKFFAIRCQQVPFVMMDMDLMVWENLQPHIASHNLMAFHTESLIEQASCYIDYKYLKKRKGYKPDPSWDWEQNPYNTALTYFADSSFVDYYTDKAIDFMRGNTARPMEMVSQMVFAEQRIFGMCAKKMGIPVGTFLNSPNEDNPAFTHIWGGKEEARSNAAVGKRLSTSLARAIATHFDLQQFSPSVRQLISKYYKQ